MNKILAIVVIGMSAGLLWLAAHNGDNRIAPGKRTEGSCPPNCVVVAHTGHLSLSRTE